MLGNELLTKILAVLFLATLLAGSIGGVIWKWNSMKEEIITLTNDKAELQLDLDQKKIDIIDKDNINKNLISQLRKSNNELERLQKKFSGIDFFGGASIGAAALVKPIETQQKLNKLNSDLFRCIEISSGSLQTAEEKKNNENLVCSNSVVVK